jgi:hypothetical protein
MQQGLAAMLMVSLMSFTPGGDEAFEGTFTYSAKMKMGDRDREMQLKCFVKPGKMLTKMENDAMPKGGMKILMDKDQSNFFMLVNRNGKKVAMKQSLEQYRSMGNKASSAADLSYEKTDRTKTINGYECTLYKIKGEQRQGEAWITDELAIDMNGMFGMMQSGPSGGRTGSMVPDEFPENGFPIQFNMQVERKDQQFSMATRVKAIEEKTISKERFDISDYRVMDMGSMPKPDK